MFNIFIKELQHS